mmetsp:Transcript_10123/g.21752  ORF Transcript_10123/g.21752 Transcript_10123/m.21752 type:complete len:156 (-) Transcript_10123:21-488(-)
MQVQQQQSATTSTRTSISISTNDCNNDCNGDGDRKEKQVTASNGNTNVLKLYPKFPQLGNWVAKQRQLRAKKKILNYRAAKLESIGVLWMVVKTRWDSMFRLLQNYKEIHGNTKVPKYYKPNPKFGRWVHFQRAKRVKKQLNGYRGLCLASIGFE